MDSLLAFIHARGYGMIALPNYRGLFYGDPDALGDHNPPPGFLFVSNRAGHTLEELHRLVEEYLKLPRGE